MICVKSCRLILVDRILCILYDVFVTKDTVKLKNGNIPASFEGGREIFGEIIVLLRRERYEVQSVCCFSVSSFATCRLW